MEDEMWECMNCTRDAVARLSDGGEPTSSDTVCSLHWAQAEAAGEVSGPSRSRAEAEEEAETVASLLDGESLAEAGLRMDERGRWRLPRVPAFVDPRASQGP